MLLLPLFFSRTMDVLIPLVLLVLLGPVPQVLGYSSGQVSGNCGDMTPGHGVSPQNTQSPYTISIDQNSVSPGAEVKVSLQGPTSTPFEGFMLEARQPGGQSPLGSFAVGSSAAQLLTCSQKANAAVSHTSNSKKTNIQVTWKSDPASAVTAVQFQATFVQSYRTFWVAVNGPVLSLNGSGSTGSNSTSAPSVGQSGPSVDIIRAHGALMLIAWMTTGPLGMIVARFLKGVGSGEKICNKDLWFVIHVLLMSLTVVATAIAFILAFSFVSGWAEGAHPVLGCLVMILALIQPTLAIFRCGPQDPWRFLFNWAHFFIALSVRFLAVAAIFTGVQMMDSTQDLWLLKVMGGFAAWEALTYGLLELRARWRTSKAGDSLNFAKDVLLVALYLCGNLCFLIALLVGISRMSYT